MEIKEIRFSSTKVGNNILIALLAWLGAIILLILPISWITVIGAMSVFVYGCSKLYFALNSTSGKPQIILSDEGIYIHFNIKKTIPWRSIESAAVRNQMVDERMIPYIKIKTRIKTNAPSNILVREFPVENLDVEPQDLENLISDYIFAYKNRPIQS